MKVRASALIFLLLASSFAANVVAPTKSEIEAMYATASRELNAGNYSEALKKLDAIDARQPDLAAAQNLRGVALMRQAEYRAAETALRKAREIDPELWEARFNLAEVPFLMQNWTEARRRFEALAAENNDQVEDATNDLIQFKILLNFVLEGKEKLGAAILDKLQTSRDSPAPYYVKAALALRQKNQKEAKVSMAAAEKEFSPQLNKLFVESFYEVGWLQRPQGAPPVTLEAGSTAERVAQVQENFEKAERAYRQQDFANALWLLDKIDAAAPNQAVAYNLRGVILLDEGKSDEAEAAWRTALAADPEFQEARFNLTRIPFKKGDYKTSRQELEALLGATSGDKRQQQREQLIRYRIFLTLLLEGRESAAQKAMEEFKMIDETPALFYAQAAWAFQHGNPRQGNNWVANANNLYSSELNRSFASSLADLDWLHKAEAQAPPIKSSLAKADILPPTQPSQTSSLRKSSPAADSMMAEDSLGRLGTTVESADAPAPLDAETPVPIRSKTDVTNATSSQTVTPEASAKQGEELKNSRQRDSSFTGTKKRRAARVRSTPAAPAAATGSTPTTGAVGERPHQNFGDKVVRLLLYPFQHRKNNSAGTAAPPESEHAQSSRGKPSPPEQSQPKN
jgi:Flp pilus assembly protein TadD